jgi:hypothetical protein
MGAHGEVLKCMYFRLEYNHTRFHEVTDNKVLDTGEQKLWVQDYSLFLFILEGTQS